MRIGVRIVVGIRPRGSVHRSCLAGRDPRVPPSRNWSTPAGHCAQRPPPLSSRVPGGSSRRTQWGGWYHPPGHSFAALHLPCSVGSPPLHSSAMRSPTFPCLASTPPRGAVRGGSHCPDNIPPLSPCYETHSRLRSDPCLCFDGNSFLRGLECWREDLPGFHSHMKEQPPSAPRTDACTCIRSRFFGRLICDG